MRFESVCKIDFILSLTREEMLGPSSLLYKCPAKRKSKYSTVPGIKYFFHFAINLVEQRLITIKPVRLNEQLF